MPKIAIYNLMGEKLRDEEMGSKILETTENKKVVAQAVNRLLANKRSSIAHTKMRGEVSGGGKKPYKQKGTGNARAGSSRSPLWSGGGVTFGPRNVRNFSKRIPEKMNTEALKMVLTEKNNKKEIIVLDKFEMDKISTKQVQGIFETLPIKEGKILVVLAEMNPNIELSLANIPYVKVIYVQNINIFDLMKYNFIVISRKDLELLFKQFGAEEVVKTKKAAK